MAGRIVLQQTGDSFVKIINQVGHGFSAGNWVRAQGTGVYVLALADNEVNAEVIGIVEEVIDSDNFRLRTAGYIEDSSIVPNEPSGTVFGLDPDTAGLATKDPSLEAGDISKPLFVVT